MKFTDLWIITNTSSELCHRAGQEKISTASWSWEARAGRGSLGPQTQPLYHGQLSRIIFPWRDQTPCWDPPAWPTFPSLLPWVVVDTDTFLWQDNFLSPKLGSSVEDSCQDYHSSRTHGEKTASSFSQAAQSWVLCGSTAPAHCLHIDAAWKAPRCMTCHPAAVLKGHGSPSSSCITPQTPGSLGHPAGNRCLQVGNWTESSVSFHVCTISLPYHPFWVTWHKHVTPRHISRTIVLILLYLMLRYFAWLSSRTIALFKAVS